MLTPTPIPPRRRSPELAALLALALAGACSSGAQPAASAGAPAEAAKTDEAAKTEDAAAAQDAAKAEEAARAAKAAKRTAPAGLAKGERKRLDEQPDADARRRFADALSRGRKATGKKSFPEAIAAFDEALVALPEHPRALSGRGYAKLLAGELDAAEVDLRAALAKVTTRELESAVHFNLGLVAEKRGDQEEARRRFAIANTMRPSKAAAAKLAQSKACPVSVHYEGKQELFSDFRELWSHLKENSLVTGAAPADEAAARAAACLSHDVNDIMSPPKDGCVGADPWLVVYEDEGSGGWAAYVIESADSDQLRLHYIAAWEGARCGQSDAFTMKDGGEYRVLRHAQTFGAEVDVMEAADGEIVDCDYEGDCFMACGEDATQIHEYIFNPYSISPVEIAWTEEAGVEVRAAGMDATVKGPGCEQSVPLRQP
ncbi:MAG: hypothetical protein R3A79_13265 [Nannocystaceae bacterium]